MCRCSFPLAAFRILVRVCLCWGGSGWGVSAIRPQLRGFRGALGAFAWLRDRRNSRRCDNVLRLQAVSGGSWLSVAVRGSVTVDVAAGATCSGRKRAFGLLSCGCEEVTTRGGGVSVGGTFAAAQGQGVPVDKTRFTIGRCLARLKSLSASRTLFLSRRGRVPRSRRRSRNLARLRTLRSHAAALLSGRAVSLSSRRLRSRCRAFTFSPSRVRLRDWGTVSN
jgi:hypothetical protein